MLEKKQFTENIFLPMLFKNLKLPLHSENISLQFVTQKTNPITKSFRKPRCSHLWCHIYSGYMIYQSVIYGLIQIRRRRGTCKHPLCPLSRPLRRDRWSQGGDLCFLGNLRTLMEKNPSPCPGLLRQTRNRSILPRSRCPKRRKSLLLVFQPVLLLHAQIWR